MGLALEQWNLKVVANQRAFYGDRMHFEPGSRVNPQRAGIPFFIRADALTYDREGRMHVTKDLKPVLPSWANPQQEVTAIPKEWDHVVVDPNKVNKKKRKVPAAVKAVAPPAWPKNQKRRTSDDVDLNKPLKIKRAGTGEFGSGGEENDEDEG